MQQLERMFQEEQSLWHVDSKNWDTGLCFSTLFTLEYGLHRYLAYFIELDARLHFLGCVIIIR